jgi:hypothetical protein
MFILESSVPERDILVRIRIGGSYLYLTDPDPALFVNDLQDANKK